MKPVRGVVLAGGRGTRLGKLTAVASKQLLPVYDEPMVHFPIRTLMDAGIQPENIAVITTPESQDQFRTLLGNKFTYLVQPEPRGIADALLVAKEFIGQANVALILGDNIFGPSEEYARCAGFLDIGYAACFTREVLNPGDYGVVVCNHMRPVDIVEKPTAFMSRRALTGLYILPNSCVGVAEHLRPSKRGHLEIVDVLNYYLLHGILVAHPLGPALWFDCGTPEGLYDATCYVRHCRQSGSTLGQIP